MYGWREIHRYRYMAIPKPAAPAADLGQAATGPTVIASKREFPSPKVMIISGMQMSTLWGLINRHPHSHPHVPPQASRPFVPNKLKMFTIS